MKSIGNMGEATFLAVASGKGLIVAHPFGDIAPYDFIIDNGNKLLKVQVKTANKCNNVYYFSCKNGATHSAYEKDSFDYLAAYCADIDTWYILPQKDILGMSTLTISPFSMRATKYDKYYENWSHFLHKK